MVRGKKRIGYELEVKVTLTGVKGSRWEGIECSYEITDFCDDGSDPEISFNVTKDSKKGTADKFK